MYKLLSAFLFLIVLVISVDTRADDNLSVKRYVDATKIPGTFYNLGGGSAMVKQTYKDDDGDVRTDKSYYTASHSYKSTYKAKDISKMLNPATGKLGSLFEETRVRKSTKGSTFDVNMIISTFIADFDCVSGI